MEVKGEASKTWELALDIWLDISKMDSIIRSSMFVRHHADTRRSATSWGSGLGKGSRIGWVTNSVAPVLPLMRLRRNTRRARSWPRRVNCCEPSL